MLGVVGTAAVGSSFGLAAQASSESGGITVPEGETKVVDRDRHIGHERIEVDGDLVIDGDVTFTFDGFDTKDRGAHLGITGGGSITFANEGDTLWIDQTAENLAVSTYPEAGFQMGDGRGRIIFNGTADLTHHSGDGPGMTFVFFPPTSGSVEVNGVAWPHGSAEVYDHPNEGRGVASDIGFSWGGTGGSVSMKNCWISGWSHNTFYYRAGEGYLDLENCLIEYSGSRGLGVPMEGLDIRDSTIVVGSKKAYQLHSWGAGATAFQLEGHGVEDHPREVYIENVDVVHDTCERYDGGTALFGTWNNQSDFAVEIVDSRYDADDIPWGVTGDAYEYEGDFDAPARPSAMQSKREEVFTHGKPERRSLVDCGRVN